MSQDFKITRDLMREAYRRGLTLSAFLETLDPTSKLSQADRQELGGDAFERQLRRLDIRTRSIPEAGIPAHKVDRFYDDSDGRGDERRVLFPEWLSRVYRRAAHVEPRKMTGSTLGDGRRHIATNQPISDVLFPEAMEAGIRYQQLEPSLLSFLVGRQRTIDSGTFKAFYLDDSTQESDARMTRVGEYADVPVMRLAGSDQSIDLQKYGRRFQASYESLRRVSLDVVAWAVEYIAAKADNDKFLTAIDVIVNGDGNSGTAATNTNGSTLDAAASSALTLKMLLAWGMLWSRPHQANVIIAQDAGILDLLLLSAGSANLPPQTAVTAAGALGAVSLARPIYGGMLAINDSSAPANKLVGLDNRYTLEMVTEAGADIVEAERVISGQYEQIVITETVGFDIMTKGQNRTLAYTA